MPEVTRVTQDQQTSTIYRVRGQRSRWTYPDPQLTPEHCTILFDVNLSRAGTADTRYGYATYNNSQLAGGEVATGLWQGTFANGTTRNVVVTPTAVYNDDGTTRTTITGTALTGTVQDRVRFEMLKDQLLFSNGVDSLRTWSGSLSSNTTALSGTNFSKCVDFITHQNLLLVFGTTESGSYKPTRVRWCDINKQTLVVDINTWREVDRYEIYDGGPAIIGAVDNWGQALVFKRDGLYPGKIVYAQVGNLDFQLGQPRRGFTPVSKLSLVARPDFVFGVAREGLFVISPDLSYKLINDDDITAWLDLNQDRLQYMQSFVREKDQQIRVVCASSSESTYFDRVLVWDWNTGNIWFDRPNVSSNYSRSVLISNVEWDWTAGSTGYLFKGNNSSYRSDNGTDINWRIKMAPNDLGMPGKQKKVVNLRLFYRKVTGSQTLNVLCDIDEGRQAPVRAAPSIGTGQTWTSGLDWNTGKKWSGSKARRVDVFINRVCETITPDFYSDDPLGIDGYQVEYVPLEE